MSEPKRHHTLPQFYMERFAVDGRVDVVDRDDPTKFFNAKPRNVLAEKHFYSVETDDGYDASLEKMFSTHVEGPAAAAFKRVFDEGYSLDAPGRRAAISLFLAFQCVRGPGTRRDLVHQHETAAKAIGEFATPESLRRYLAERQETITDEQMADVAKYAQLGQYELMVERAADLHLDILVKHALEMVPYIAGRTWVVLEFGAPLLLTSDEPVGYVGQDIDEPGDAQGVAGSPQLVFPIDPWRALLMFRPDMPAESGRFTADRESADVVTRHVAFTATRSLVRRPGTDPLAGLTVPKKAPASFSVGNMIFFQPYASEKARAKVLAQIGRGEMPFRAFPLDPDAAQAALASRSRRAPSTATRGRRTIARIVPAASDPTLSNEIGILLLDKFLLAGLVLGVAHYLSRKLEIFKATRVLEGEYTRERMKRLDELFVLMLDADAASARYAALAAKYVEDRKAPSGFLAVTNKPPPEIAESRETYRELSLGLRRRAASSRPPTGVHRRPRWVLICSPARAPVFAAKWIRSRS